MNVNKKNVSQEKSKFVLIQNKRMVKQSPHVSVSKTKLPKRKARLKRRRKKKNILLRLKNKVALNLTHKSIDKNKSL